MDAKGRMTFPTKLRELIGEWDSLCGKSVKLHRNSVRVDRNYSYLVGGM
jgi:DNA-binding transcriptional regulator/RsmH inhibitor MraZ